MVPEVDDDGITGHPGLTSSVLKGDCEVVCMAAYCRVGTGIKGANFELLQNIVASTDGRWPFIIAAGDFNLPSEELEASGILRALGQFGHHMHHWQRVND